MYRYMRACEGSFVVFSESRMLKGYITNELPNKSRCMADIYTNWFWFRCYMLC